MAAGAGAAALLPLSGVDLAAGAGVAALPAGAGAAALLPLSAREDDAALAPGAGAAVLVCVGVPVVTVLLIFRKFNSRLQGHTSSRAAAEGRAKRQQQQGQSG